MFEIVTTKAFERDLNKCNKRGYNLELLVEVLDLLANNNKGLLKSKYRDHSLVKSNKYSGFYREVHIGSLASDWILIYRCLRDEKIVILTRTGTHSDLF